jgi:C2 domain
VYSQEKVCYRLEQAKVRLAIESKVKEGTQRMLEAVKQGPETPDSSLKLKECESKIKECQSKIYLLEISRKRYESVCINPEALKQSDSFLDLEKLNKGDKVKELMSGKLKCKFISATGLPGKKSSKTSVFATLSIDNQQKRKTRATHGVWNEDLNVLLDKARNFSLRE